MAHDEWGLTPIQRQQFLDWVARRAAGEPIAYLTGEQEFHGLLLRVTADTLVPRPDTETLVDWALDLLPQGGRVADLGTGSGAIALALKHGRPDAAVTATDRSPAALAVAQANGQRLGLAVDWRCGSWFEPLGTERFELIVSNPPYIAGHDPHLPALRHEPLQALTPGGDGLDDLRRLATVAAAHLQAGGWLLLEHGFDQADAVAALLREAGFSGVEHRRDLAGHRRCTGARRPY
jgi:release factor glutamine methyltransferase